MPAENSRAVVSISDHILPKAARDRFGLKVNAQRDCALPSCGQCDANRKPARTSKAEIHLPSRVIRPRLLLRVDSEARIRLALAHVQSLRSFHELAYRQIEGTRRAASGANSRREHPIRNTA